MIKEGFTRVTEVLSIYNDFSGIPEDVLQNACERGTVAHSAIETFLQYGYETDNPYLESYLKWHNFMNPKDWISEKRIYNEQYRLTGAIDLLCKLEGSSAYTLIDFKTPVSKSKTWGLQIAAYAWLASMEGLPIERMVVLQVKKDGSQPKFVEYTEEQAKNIQLYQSALKLYRHFVK